jgi:hypothetical protein
MEEIPSRMACSHPVRQEIHCFLWKSKFLYLVYDIPPLIPILGNKNKDSADMSKKIID